MNISCSICSEKFTDSTDIVANKCGHIYHHQCLSAWINNVQTCPQCRKKCTFSTTYKLYFNHEPRHELLSDVLSQYEMKRNDFPLLKKQLDEMKIHFDRKLANFEQSNLWNRKMYSCLGFVIILSYLMFLHSRLNVNNEMLEKITNNSSVGRNLNTKQIPADIGFNFNLCDFLFDLLFFSLDL